MIKYKVIVPIYLEFVSEYDFHDMEIKQEVELNTAFSLKSLTFNVTYSNGNGMVIISNIDAQSELGAFIIARGWMDSIVRLLSFYVQKQNENQNYGSMRFNWFNKEMEISPKDGIVSEDFQSLLTYNVSLENFSEGLKKINKSEGLKFISTAYYGALQSSDHKAKYYHAFTIMEYLEQRHSNDGWDKKFNKLDCDEVGQEIYKKFIEKGYQSDVANSAKGTVINILSKTTIKNRQEKLVSILNEFYDINKVEYLIDIDINVETIKKLIETRNKLFHGGDITNLKHNMDILILICEKVYWCYLNQEI